jgi:hypothetical protein
LGLTVEPLDDQMVAALAAEARAAALAAALVRFKPRMIDPKTKSETVHKEMAEYVQTLIAMVELDERKIATKRDEIAALQKAAAQQAKQAEPVNAT